MHQLLEKTSSVGGEQNPHLHIMKWKETYIALVYFDALFSDNCRYLPCVKSHRLDGDTS